MSEITKLQLNLEFSDSEGRLSHKSLIQEVIFKDDRALHLLLELLTLNKPDVFEEVCYLTKSIRRDEFGQRHATLSFVPPQDDETFNTLYTDYVKGCVTLCEGFETMLQTMSFEEAKVKFIESTAGLRDYLFVCPTENNITKFVQFVCSSLIKLEDFDIVVLVKQLTKHLADKLEADFEPFTLLPGLRVHTTEAKDVGDLWIYRFLLIYSGPDYVYAEIYDYLSEYFKAFQEGIMSREMKGHFL